MTDCSPAGPSALAATGIANETLRMQPVHMIDRVATSDLEPPTNGIELEAALRALHAARVHLGEVGDGGSATAPLVVRSRILVGQAVSLLSAAARLQTG